MISTNQSTVSGLIWTNERCPLWSQVAGLELVDEAGIREREPACVGQRAIWSPHTGIVDWGQVARQYGRVFQSRGGEILTSFSASKFSPEGEGAVRVSSADGRSVSCGRVGKYCSKGVTENI